jgi:hypothetical protein
VLTLGALVTEFSLAFLLWVRPSRKWVALAGIMLHAGIVPIVNVPLFGEQMIALYLLFLTREEMDGLLEFVNPWSWIRNRRTEWAALSARLHPAKTIEGWRQLELAFDTPESGG